MIRPRSSHLILGHDFLHCLQPLFVVFEYGLNSNESDGAEEQTQNR